MVDMEPEHPITSAARDVIDRPEFNEIHAALDRLPIKTAIFMATSGDTRSDRSSRM